MPHINQMKRIPEVSVFSHARGVDTGRLADPLRAAPTAVFIDLGSPSSCFRRSFSPQFLEQQTSGAAVSHPASAARLGCRCTASR
ncbi:hypothetical protein LDENG_00003940 [Lucifuga dentata]|nr:hypothetical protein LDENG_00003940 [Lucifuga dentata]